MYKIKRLKSSSIGTELIGKIFRLSFFEKGSKQTFFTAKKLTKK